MTRFLVLLLVLGSVFPAKAQFLALQKPSSFEIAQAPLWAQWMYSDTAVVAHVDAAYEAWFRNRVFEKSYHTQYYKRWRRQAALAIDENGRLDQQKLARFFGGNVDLSSSDVSNQRGGSVWSPMGPMQTYNNSGAKENDQTNVYSLTQCAADPSILYCGTEPGEIYKSTDGGLSWNPSSQPYFFNGVEAICVDPTNPDVVYASNGWSLMKSADGGSTWNAVLTVTSLWAKEILVLASNPNIVLVAANTGLYRSTDAGANWVNLNSVATWDVKSKPGDDNIIYVVQNNPTLKRAEFWKSTNQGASFSLKDNGWYSSTDPARTDGGSRLAVTPADPQRVYAYLIGEAKAGDLGFIGVYRSNDGGENWYLPNGPTGGPYTASHPNLAIGWPGWDYHQGYYNCALAASQTNADDILIGGLNLWKSNDGGTTFSVAGGYLGGYLPIHVDMQDFRVTSAGTWITNDGGISFSNDFYASDMDIRMEGLHGSDYWGLGIGWNDDVSVGGLYHNGNLAWNENYGEGRFLQLGGAEPPSGYVNPGQNRKVYSSELGSVIMPESIVGPIVYGALGLAPNESYWTASSSEMEFDPSYYNIAWVGRDQNLWRSEDGGSSFNLAYTFPGTVNAEVRYFEIARSNSQVMYVSQAPSSGSVGRLWKTTDGAVSFSELTLPGSGGGRERILLQVDPENHNIVYLAYPSGAATAKVYRSEDGGASWINISGSVFATHEIRSLLLTGATNGGLYAATDKGIFFRDLSMGDWEAYADGLPAYANSNILKPFYRDGELRLASYGKGVWEAPMRSLPDYPIAKAMVDKQFAICSIDTFRFEDYSILMHDGASWSWTFEDGVPATSALRNPMVTFNGDGDHWAVLTVEDALGQTSTDSIRVTLTGVESTDIAENFESLFPPDEWTTQGLNSGAGIWNKTNLAGGFGTSSNSASADNYNIDLQSGYGDLRAFINLQPNATKLSFDVSYAPYGFPYSDSLEVLISTDCGVTFTSLYFKGGVELSTAPAFSAGMFIPTAEQWRTEELDMTPWAGIDGAMLVFRDHGSWGQILYLDNVNVDGFPVGIGGPGPRANLRLKADIFPNPISLNGYLRLDSELEGLFELHLFDVEGRQVHYQQVQSGESFSPGVKNPGIYLYRLEGDVYMKTGVLIVR